MRHTSSHTKNRRSHHALVEQGIVTDKESGNLRLPHRLDEKTGMYRGVQIVKAKVEKKKGQKKEKVVKATNTNPAPEKHIQTEEREKKQGLLGRMTQGKAKSRSGFGGGV
jgi:large subunit ribosomal protein L32